ncbi:MAG: Flp pilus assembly protein CpaB [Bryobacteraceae bacterium]
MKQRFALVLIFALVVSAAASVVLYRLIANQISKNKEAAQSKIVVASRSLSGGDLIKESDVKLADWAGAPPAGALTKVEDAVNRGVIESIYEGEAILEARIAARGAGAGLASTIPPGMRAVAVRVNDVVGVSGYVIAGSHVDILIAGNPPSGSNAGTVTKTLLQNVEVLSAGQNTQKDAEGKPISVPVVNLLVTPEQAEILSLASNDARIQLVLRNPMDKEQVKTPGTALSYLFNGGVAPAPAPVAAARPAPRRPDPPPPPPVQQVEPPKPPPPPITVEVFHGTRKTESKFAAGENPEGKR